MRIGIDIDNVISDFDNALLRAYLKHDKEIYGKGIVNPQAKYIRKGMFDWSEEEESDFYYKNIEEIATHLKPIHRAPEIITQLKEEGNEIYIISGRDNQEYTKPFEMTKEWLEKHHIPYDELLLTNAYDKQAKTKVCLEKGIAIMIEDNTGTCKDLMENGITVWMMNTRFNQNNLEIERVSSWEEIHKKIKKISPKKAMEKIPVILDYDSSKMV